MRFYRSSSTDATLNLALEELLTRDGEDCFMLWRNSPSVIIGRNQNTAAEVNAALLRTHGIPVIRRITGGGAVYHDLGNINFSFIANPVPAEVCCRPLLGALQSMGYSCALSGRNDIVSNGVKISGCASSVHAGRMLFHGTLLYDADLDMLSKILNPDPEKIRSKGIASVRARVGNLRAMREDSRDTEYFLSGLGRQIAAELHSGDAEEPPAELMRKADVLANEKYRTDAWNWGSPFPYDVVRKKRFAGGSVAAELQIRENRIEGLRFTGDFFGELPAEELAAELTGLALDRKILLENLSKRPVSAYFSRISADELLELLCP